MTVSSADTAELFLEPSRQRIVPPLRVVPPPVAAAPIALDRITLRAERQQLRRTQQLWALAGMSALAVSLGATVAVLDLIH